MGVPVVIDGDNLPSPVGIGLSDLPIIGGGGQWPPGPPGSRTTDFSNNVVYVVVLKMLHLSEQ